MYQTSSSDENTIRNRPQLQSEKGPDIDEISSEMVKELLQNALNPHNL